MRTLPAAQGWLRQPLQKGAAAYLGGVPAAHSQQRLSGLRAAA